jgi:hypothetical protein
LITVTKAIARSVLHTVHIVHFIIMSMSIVSEVSSVLLSVCNTVSGIVKSFRKRMVPATLLPHHPLSPHKKGEIYTRNERKGCGHEKSVIQQLKSPSNTKMQSLNQNSQTL